MLTLLESDYSGTNFVMVMRNSATVAMRTQPSSALMTHSLPAEILLRVRMKKSSLLEYFLIIHHSCPDPRGGRGYSVNDGREAVASAGPHVRSTISYLFIDLTYILLQEKSGSSLVPH